MIAAHDTHSTWISKSQAALRMGVRLATLNGMIERGLLTTRQLPGSITRIPQEEVDALIASSTRPATQRGDATSAA